MSAMAVHEKSEEKRLPRGFVEGQRLMTAEDRPKKKGTSDEDGAG